MLKGQAAPGRVRKTLRLAFGATEALRNRSSQLRLKALLVASALCAENLLNCVDSEGVWTYAQQALQIAKLPLSEHLSHVCPALSAVASAVTCMQH